MSQLLNTAILVAHAAHHGQTDKMGVPYIRHPKTVASFLEDDTDKIIAMLHDVLEDTFLTEDDLRPVFGDEIVDILKLLTRGKEEDYFTYINRVGTNERAKRVKLADLRHNSDITRIKNPTQKDFDRLEKYQKATRILRGEK